MSASQANILNTCGMQWCLQYYEKAEADDKKTFMATLFGSALHAVLEDLFSDKKFVQNEKQEDILERALSVFIDYFKEDYKSHKERGYNIIVGAKKPTDVVNEYIYTAKIATKKVLSLNLFDKYDKISCEEEFEYDDERFLINGKIDFLLFNKKLYDVIDFKTGKHFTYKGLHNDLQMIFYIVMTYHKFKKLANDFKFMKFNRESLSLSMIDCLEPIDNTILKVYDESVQALSDKIDDGIKNGFGKIENAYKCQYCQWCNFKSTCKKRK